ncbi:protein of unknown function (plasmid) [Methylocella tundrae]|uniref:Uncharacterized protein n=1 Tax=Methylocella tundrae TaxID=227605 RepID=A0A4U8Z6J3_METTU|nr:protein of unknown function [Methylocella tundrae]
MELPCRQAFRKMEEASQDLDPGFDLIARCPESGAHIFRRQ